MGPGRLAMHPEPISHFHFPFPISHFRPSAVQPLCGLPGGLSL